MALERALQATMSRDSTVGFSMAGRWGDLSMGDYTTRPCKQSNFSDRGFPRKAGGSMLRVSLVLESGGRVVLGERIDDLDRLGAPNRFELRCPEEGEVRVDADVVVSRGGVDVLPAGGVVTVGRYSEQALPPPRTLEDVIGRAIRKGGARTPDQIWTYVLHGSQRTNKAVDNKAGL